jgi:hypothetical protein
MNPYRGCEHGCIYCFARPTHAYHDLSPGLDFETRLFAKPDAPVLLRAELGKRGYVCRPIAFGTNTDPYQPIEATWRITRGCIEVLAECNHPLTITTKSDRVTRDIDLLAPMAAKGLAAVMVSITSLDPKIAMTVEPRAPFPSAARRGPHADRCRHSGVRLAGAGDPGGHRSRDGAYPGGAPPKRAPSRRLLPAGAAAARSRAAVPRVARDAFPRSRGQGDGDDPVDPRRRDNDPNFHTRFRGQGPWAELLRTRFHIAAKKYGLDGERLRVRTDLRLRTDDLFRPPSNSRAAGALPDARIACSS